MNTLLVLTGLPGVGKTTLRQAWINAHPDFQVVDVFFFVRKYLDNAGRAIVENFDIRGYRDMYAHLFSQSGNILLEIGTNFPRLNTRMLKRFQDNGWNVVIVLCLLDRVEVRRRHSKRGTADRDIPYREEYYAQRIHRNFPGSYRAMCPPRGLQTRILDMSCEVEKNVQHLEYALRESQ